MSFSDRSVRRVVRFVGLAGSLLVPSIYLYGQSPSCPAVAAHAATPAETAYSEGRYDAAEDLYGQALAKNAQDVDATAGLVHTLLHEGKVTQAAKQMETILAANPHSASLLTAQAEIELRQGQPWLAMQSLDAAGAADPCYARTHLVRSRVLRIDSMHASERAELQKAYDIDPTDPDIQHAWLSIDSPAHDIDGIDKALAAEKNIDPETRQKAEASMHAMLPLLYEDSQTCKGVPAVPSATLPLQALLADTKHIDGYKIDVDLPQGKARLRVDTAASGLFITKTLADQNGFQPRPGDPPGTVHVDSLHIGPLEFRDCVVGVSESPFEGKLDGFIGTDIFSSWLITLDYRAAKMILAPLPPQPGILPGDRTVPSDFADYTPVYHRRQYLLVPLTFGNKSRKLFILATGMRLSAMSSEAAHSVSKMTVNFTNTESTASGGKIQVFRDTFDIQLGNLQQIHQSHILELDPSIINRNAGFQVAGMLGLDVLQPLTLHLDYRDGLVKFESTEIDVNPMFGKKTMIASAGNEMAAPTCQVGDTIDRPLNSMIEAAVTGGLDSAHLKAGKEVTLKLTKGYVYPNCTLDTDSILYGHVIAAESRSNPDGSDLSVLFDQGECTGHGKRQLKLRLVGLVAPPDDKIRRMHGEIPTELSGRAQSVSTAMAGLVNVEDEDLNPGGPPRTVHPGVVVRMPDVKLEPEGGPECSAKITSPHRSIRFGAGAELLFTMSGPS